MGTIVVLVVLAVVVWHYSTQQSNRRGRGRSGRSCPCRRRGG